jgi:dihydroxy-acid dehydratase
MPDDVRLSVVDNSRLPSRHVTVGPERAPHRAFLYSMGLSEAQINQPLVGVATTWNPCARLGVDGSHEPHRQAKGK